MTLKKNDVIKLTIESMSLGQGIGKYDNIVVFVPHACPGDILNVKIVKVKTNYCYGIIESILLPGKERISPECPSSGKCGGCVYNHITYTEEAQTKLKSVRDTIKRIGKIDNLEVDGIVKADNISRYRNKSQVPVGYDKNGNLTAGFYAPHSHRIAGCTDCLLQPEFFNTAILSVLEWIKTYNIPVYNEETRKGLIRHIYIRYGEKTDQLMVCIVAVKENLPHEEELINILKTNVDNLETVVINANPQKTNVILGSRNRTIFGNGYIEDKLCSLTFKISPLSFYQVNRTQTERLYSIAKKYANLSGNEVVLDLYCGIGTIGLSMADKAKKIIGVEIVPQAIEDAKQNAGLNKIDNAEFICMDAAKCYNHLVENDIHPDVVLIDPPRKGCEQSLIQEIVNISPEHIVYISCYAPTLARDINLFNNLGYTPIKAHIVDLFPRTEHVECVVLMSKVQK